MCMINASLNINPKRDLQDSYYKLSSSTYGHNHLTLRNYSKGLTTRHNRECFNSEV